MKFDIGSLLIGTYIGFVIVMINGGTIQFENVLAYSIGALPVMLIAFSVKHFRKKDEGRATRTKWGYRGRL